MPSRPATIASITAETLLPSKYTASCPNRSEVPRRFDVISPVFTSVSPVIPAAVWRSLQVPSGRDRSVKYLTLSRQPSVPEMLRIWKAPMKRVRLTTGKTPLMGMFASLVVPVRQQQFEW